MSKTRVCMSCYRPVRTAYFVLPVGAYCPKHGAISIDSTIKIPEDKANYEKP